MSEKKGITLIALVITIIVLLILAGVSITMLAGDNGILIRAIKAREENEKAQIVEQIQLDIVDKQTENLGAITQEEVKLIMEKYGKIEGNILTTVEGHKINVNDIFSEFKNATVTDDGRISGFEFIGHRGMSQLSADNTVEGFYAAVNVGDYGIATDPRLTSDGRIICCHDEKVTNYTNTDEYILNMTYDEIKNLKYDVQTQYSDKDITFASFDEYLQICKTNNKQAYIQIKNNLGAANAGIITYEEANVKLQELIEKVLEAIDNYGMQEQCVIFSSDINILKSVHAINSKLTLEYYVDISTTQDRAEMQEIINTAVLNCRDFTENNVIIYLWDQNNMWGTTINAEDIQPIRTAGYDIAWGVLNLKGINYGNVSNKPESKVTYDYLLSVLKNLSNLDIIKIHSGILYNSFSEEKMNEILSVDQDGNLVLDNIYKYYLCGKITIPSGVKVIPENSFYKCSAITSINMADTVERIESYSFSLSGIKNIYLSKNLDFIGTYAFEDCRQLQTINIPDNVNTISASALRNCLNLISVQLPNNGETKLRYGIFFGCKSLTTITIPTNIKEIGGSVFSGCTSLTEVIIENDESNVSIDSTAIPDNVDIIYEP